VTARLAALAEGLTTAEAVRRRALAGPNDLADRHASQPIREVAALLANPLTIILLLDELKWDTCVDEKEVGVQVAGASSPAPVRWTAGPSASQHRKRPTASPLSSTWRTTSR
jgi:cation transport ATPase-like protein